MTRVNEQAAAAARTEALAEKASMLQAEQTAATHRARRDAAIMKMKNAGLTPPEIARELDYPVSTVRSALKMAIVRSIQS